MDSALKFDEHIAHITNKANRLVGVIKRSFTYMTERIFLLLYKALVRPHLEYAQPIWKPYLRRQINTLESVQRRATKVVPALKDLPYPQRLQQLRLPTLAFRRLRGDYDRNLQDFNRQVRSCGQ